MWSHRFQKDASPLFKLPLLSVTWRGKRPTPEAHCHDDSQMTALPIKLAFHFQLHRTTCGPKRLSRIYDVTSSVPLTDTRCSLSFALLLVAGFSVLLHPQPSGPAFLCHPGRDSLLATAAMDPDHRRPWSFTVERSVLFECIQLSHMVKLEPSLYYGTLLVLS